MSQTIEKTCINSGAYLRPRQYYRQARRAFGAVLDSLHMGAGSRILVPAYIGWSAREGSGVFDPIRERGITPVFYHMTRRLEINEDDCLRKLEQSGAKVLLIIHYFGFVDPAAKRLIRAARERGVTVIEDAAHALYTDVIGGACGRDGDYTLYSLHKMLPMPEGGVLVSNGPALPAPSESLAYDTAAYDFLRIAERRTENYRLLAGLLAERHIPGVTLLRPRLDEGIVPQTLPITVEGADRNEIYAVMNDRGWGFVSLYHTMIEELRGPEYGEEGWLAAHITNLPVHQDADPALMDAMVSDLARLMGPKAAR